MKRRHLQTGMLYEDRKIWARIDLRVSNVTASVNYRSADRQDADLMLAAQQMLAVLAVQQREHPDCKVHLRGVPVGWERHNVAKYQLPFDVIA